MTPSLCPSVLPNLSTITVCVLCCVAVEQKVGRLGVWYLSWTGVRGSPPATLQSFSVFLSSWQMKDGDQLAFCSESVAPEVRLMCTKYGYSLSYLGCMICFCFEVVDCKLQGP